MFAFSFFCSCSPIKMDATRRGRLCGPAITVKPFPFSPRLVPPSCVELIIVLIAFLSFSVISCHAGLAETQIGQNCPRFVDQGDGQSAPQLVVKLVCNITQYLRYLRPVHNVDEKIKVELLVTPYQIVDLDAREQHLKAKMGFSMYWNSSFAGWDPDEVGGVKKLTIPSSLIWIPDIQLENAGEGTLNFQKLDEELVYIFHDGRVEYHPILMFQAVCPIEIKYFPLDQQRCTLNFSSWMYDSTELELVINSTMYKFAENPEWLLMHYGVFSTDIVYEGYEHTWDQVTFWFTLKRRSLTLVCLLVMPCCLLLILVLASFWVPLESPGRPVLTANLFLASTFQFQMVANKQPHSSQHLPVIGKYYAVGGFMSAVAVFLSVVASAVHKRSKSGKPPPYIMAMFADVLTLRPIRKGLHQFHKNPTCKSPEKKMGEPMKGRRVKMGGPGEGDTQTPLSPSAPDKSLFPNGHHRPSVTSPSLPHLASPMQHLNMPSLKLSSKEDVGTEGDLGDPPSSVPPNCVALRVSIASPESLSLSPTNQHSKLFLPIDPNAMENSHGHDVGGGAYRPNLDDSHSFRDLNDTQEDMDEATKEMNSKHWRQIASDISNFGFWMCVTVLLLATLWVIIDSTEDENMFF